MEPLSDDWRVLGADRVAWFGASSHAAGAELVAEILTTKGPDIDLRAGGVRVTAPADATEQISVAARKLGLTADPTRLQRLALVIDAADEEAVASFWRTALGYEPDDDRLRDPLRRDPDFVIRRRDDPRPLRNRTHVDIVRPAAAVEAVRSGLGREPYGAYGLTLADDEGNEADVVPGEPLGTDWQAVFSAIVCYPTSSPAQTADLVTTVAGLAGQAGVPLMIDVRPGHVVIDSGKDQWNAKGPPDERFAELAGQVEAAAHRLGLVADPGPPRFVQFAIDAVDVPAVQAFWMTVLGYGHDPREFLTDVYDTHRLGPVLMFQEMAASDEARRRQRNRIHFELTVPADRLDTTVDTALAAGGRVLEQAPGRRTIADPEGLELTVLAGS